ncbi:uncharacterized protein G2W53_020206 [Senna tora]|uniref:Uncharacterized protein n=1 Tax=Senna tora TaxID=362788 RepID=A0A834WNB1_9FABA|nr:uncharacterized protein G2W53_020206 [Senna tora]
MLDKEEEADRLATFSLHREEGRLIATSGRQKFFDDDGDARCYDGELLHGVKRDVRKRRGDVRKRGRTEWIERSRVRWSVSVM